MESGRVVVAMSGGVDSSVAAALLQERGYEVIGVGLRLPQPSTDGESQSACCGMAGMEDARAVATELGIPFYVLDYRATFEQEVIIPFCEAYRKGETPNPCVLCNVRLKFGLLLDMALTLDADYIATGHYARIESEPDGHRPILQKGLAPDTDQSYFLYALTSRQLEHTLFPLGTLRKDEVRATAHKRGLPVADKPSSQDICFVGPGGYREFLSRHCPDALRPGPITDRTGNVLGQHEGIGAFTLGQRKGLGIAARERLYVIALDASSNTVIVGPKEDTAVQRIAVSELNWLATDPPTSPLRLSVQTRYHGLETPADILPESDGVSVCFSGPHPISAPGQAAVFYSGDVLVGGGVITI